MSTVVNMSQKKLDLVIKYNFYKKNITKVSNNIAVLSDKIGKSYSKFTLNNSDESISEELPQNIINMIELYNSQNITFYLLIKMCINLLAQIKKIN